MEGGISKPDKTEFTECWRTTWKTSYIMRLASSAGFGGLLFGYDTEACLEFLELVQDLNEVANLQERISCCWPGERLFAHAGDSAVEMAESTAFRFRQAKTEIVTASRVAYRFLAGVASNNSLLNAESPSNPNRGGSPGFQASWFKNLISSGAKPSSSSEMENQDEETTQQQQRLDAAALLRQNSRRII